MERMKEKIVQKFIALGKKSRRLRLPVLALIVGFLVIYHAVRDFFLQFRYHPVRQRIIVGILTTALVVGQIQIINTFAEDEPLSYSDENGETPSWEGTGYAPVRVSNPYLYGLGNNLTFREGTDGKTQIFYGDSDTPIDLANLEETEDGTVIAEGCNDYTITEEELSYFHLNGNYVEGKELYLDGEQNAICIREVPENCDLEGLDLSEDGVTISPDLDADTTEYTAGITRADARKEQFPVLTAGEVYWFDLSESGLTGTVNAALPDTSLHWVPFTYTGTINAYVLNSSSSGVSTSSATASETTDSSGAYGYTYDHSLFIADYNVNTSIMWTVLNGNIDFIFGLDYVSDGITYTMRAPSGGSAGVYDSGTATSTITPANNEWDAILDKNENYIKNYSEACWVQDTPDSSANTRRVFRGNSSSVRSRSTNGKSTKYNYRPVLEIPSTVTSADLKVVTVDLNGGSIGEYTGIVNIVVKNGESFNVPSGAELTAPEGMTFKGWLDNEGQTWQYGDAVPATVTTLTPQYTSEDKGYTVTYDYSTNGGTSSTKTSDMVAANNEVDLTPTSTKTDWEFVGWNTDKDAKTGLASLTMGTEDITLYAIYKKTLTLTCYSGSAGEKQTKTVTIYNNATKGLLTVPTAKSWGVSDENYRYYYYVLSPDRFEGTMYGGNSTIYLSEDTSLYAWYRKTITISYDANGGSGSVAEQSVFQGAIVSDTVTYKEASTKLRDGTALSRDGYNFNGWIEGSSTGTDIAEAGTTITPTADTVYYASWVPADYSVTLNTNNGSGGTAIVSYTYGTGVVLPTDWTKTGYTFAGWYDNEDCTGTAVTEISATDTGDKEYWAKWVDDIAPVIGDLSYSYQPKNLWQWLIGKESLIITVPVTEEGSGADEITYTVTSENGTVQNKTEEIKNGTAVITVDTDLKGTILITCTDQAGNTSSGVTVGAGLNASGVIIEDNAPEIKFRTNKGDLLTDVCAPASDIIVTVTDNGDNAVSGGIASVVYKIENGEDSKEVKVQQDFATSMKTSTTFTIPASDILAGETVITVTAMDNAGNVASVSSGRMFVGHKYGEPVFTWNEDFSGATAAFTCEHDINHVEIKDCTVASVVTKEATGTQKGEMTYTAAVEFEGRTYTDKRSVEAVVVGQEKIGKGSITTEVLVADDVPYIIMKNLTVEAAKELLTSEELVAVEGGERVSVFLETKNINEMVSSEDKEHVKNQMNMLVENILKAEGIASKEQVNTGVSYIDISLYKKVGSNEATRLSSTGKNEIEITIEIPDEMKSSNPKRTYYIIRVHDDGEKKVVEVLPSTYNAENSRLTFMTDRFSTYAIAYTEPGEVVNTNDDGNNTEVSNDDGRHNDTGAGNNDGKDTDNSQTVKTGDDSNPALWIVILLLAAIVLQGSFLAVKKYRRQ